MRGSLGAPLFSATITQAYALISRRFERVGSVGYNLAAKSMIMPQDVDGHHRA